MSPAEHQPGDHVLVEAVVVAPKSVHDNYAVEMAGSDERLYTCRVRADDVRPAPVAPAPDTGGWAATRDGVYIVALNTADPTATIHEVPDSWPSAHLLPYVPAHVAVLALRAREREEAARTAPAPVDDERVRVVLNVMDAAGDMLADDAVAQRIVAALDVHPAGADRAALDAVLALTDAPYSEATREGKAANEVLRQVRAAITVAHRAGEEA